MIIFRILKQAKTKKNTNMSSDEEKNLTGPRWIPNLHLVIQSNCLIKPKRDKIKLSLLVASSCLFNRSPLKCNSHFSKAQVCVCVYMFECQKKSQNSRKKYSRILLLSTLFLMFNACCVMSTAKTIAMLDCAKRRMH